MLISFFLTQKSANTMSGSEMMRNKDDVAAIMRKKQEAGMYLMHSYNPFSCRKQN